MCVHSVETRWAEGLPLSASTSVRPVCPTEAGSDLCVRRPSTHSLIRREAGTAACSLSLCPCQSVPGGSNRLKGFLPCDPRALGLLCAGRTVWGRSPWASHSATSWTLSGRLPKPTLDPSLLVAWLPPGQDEVPGPPCSVTGPSLLRHMGTGTHFAATGSLCWNGADKVCLGLPSPHSPDTGGGGLTLLFCRWVVCGRNPHLDWGWWEVGGVGRRDDHRTRTEGRRGQGWAFNSATLRRKTKKDPKQCPG